MEKVLEFLKCKTEHGIERSTSIRSLVTLEVTSGIIDQMPPNNGSSISLMVVLENSSSKDGLLTSVAESGLEWSGSQLPFTSSVPLSVKESTITTLMITSTSPIERPRINRVNSAHIMKINIQILYLKYSYSQKSWINFSI